MGRPLVAAPTGELRSQVRVSGGLGGGAGEGGEAEASGPAGDEGVDGPGALREPAFSRFPAGSGGCRRAWRVGCGCVLRPPGGGAAWRPVLCRGRSRPRGQEAAPVNARRRAVPAVEAAVWYVRGLWLPGLPGSGFPSARTPGVSAAGGRASEGADARVPGWWGGGGRQGRLGPREREHEATLRPPRERPTCVGPPSVAASERSSLGRSRRRPK